MYTTPPLLSGVYFHLLYIHVVAVIGPSEDNKLILVLVLVRTVHLTELSGACMNHDIWLAEQLLLPMRTRTCPVCGEYLHSTASKTLYSCACRYWRIDDAGDTRYVIRKFADIGQLQPWKIYG